MSADRHNSIAGDAGPDAASPSRLFDELPTRALEELLRGHTWYGAHSKRLARHRLLDAVPIAVSPTPLTIVLAELVFDDGSCDRLQLLLSVEERATGGPTGDVASFALEGGSVVLLRDVANDPAAGSSLFDFIANGSHAEGDAGRLEVRRSRELADWHFSSDAVRTLGAEGSNSSMIFGDHFFLKLIRRVEFGPNPDLEINRFLTEQTDFAGVPQVCGDLVYRSDAGAAVLALVQEFVSSTGTAWDAAIERLDAYFEAPDSRSAHNFDSEARQIGKTLGELHLALASEELSSEFAPEAITAEDFARWWASVTRRLEALEEAFDDRAHMFSALWRETVFAFRGIEPTPASGGLKLRHHGDFHLKQILETDDAWTVLDFEGEPTRPLRERLEKSSPLRDVAALLRSLEYAAYSELRGRSGSQSVSWRERRATATAWIEAARRAFLEGYYEEVGDAAFLPDREQDRASLIRVFELERAVTDLAYNLDCRPSWVEIDLEILRRLIGSANGGGEPEHAPNRRDG